MDERYNGSASHFKLSFGQSLRAMRQARGLTMDAIAHVSGRNQSYLSSIERDKVMPSSEFLNDIATYYGCPWWHAERNRIWLQQFAWLHGNVNVGDARGGQADAIKAALIRAEAAIQTLTKAIETDPDIRVQFDETMGQLQLPGITRLKLEETLVIWAWIIASLESTTWDQCHQSSVIDNAYCLLSLISLKLRRDSVDVDSVALGTKVRRLRLSKGWTAENLALVINRAWAQTHPRGPLVDTQLVLDIEKGTTAVNLDVLSAIADVFDITPSSLLTNAENPEFVTEQDVAEVLREYGLNDEGIASMLGLLAYWRERNGR